VVNNNIRIDGDFIKLPKIGLVKMRKNRKSLPPNSIIKAVTVSKTLTGKYFISLRLEIKQETNSRDDNFKRVIGLDFSTTHFYINNMGEKANFPTYIEKTLDKIKES
jgi:putative transposase